MKYKMTTQQRLVLIGACLFQCAFIGILINSAGVILAQIRVEFGFSLTRISSYHTLKGLMGALGGVLFTSLFFKVKQPIYMSVNILLVVTSFLLLIVDARSNALWYLSACLSGTSFCTSTVMVPFILNRWFPHNAGATTGVAMAFSGLGGVVFNPLTAWLIESFGWRMAIIALAAITLLMAGVALVLMFRTPAPAGEAQFLSQDREKTAHTVTAGDSGKFPMGRFALCTTALIASNIVMQFCQYVTIFAQGVGYSLQTGAALTSVFMIGNVGGKLLFGFACDRVGVYKTMVAAMVSIACGSLLFAFCYQYLPVLYLASILYGVVYGLAMISISRCCIETYGVEDAKKYMGLHTSINGVLQAVSSMAVGVLHDWSGGFETQLLGGIGFLIISACAVIRLDWLCHKVPDAPYSADKVAEG